MHPSPVFWVKTGKAQKDRNMKTFLLDLWDWIVLPSSYWLYLEACHQERMKRQKGTKY